MQYFKYMQQIYIFCRSHLLHIYALSAAGQIRQTEIGFFFSFRLGSAGTLVLPGIIRSCLNFNRRFCYNSFHLILAVSNNCHTFATRISATPLIQAYQGGTFFFRCYAVHQSTADHSGSDFTSSEQRAHNKRCRKGRVRIEKYQLLPLGDICIDYGIDQATYISSPVCL